MPAGFRPPGTPAWRTVSIEHPQPGIPTPPQARITVSRPGRPPEVFPGGFEFRRIPPWSRPIIREPWRPTPPDPRRVAALVQIGQRRALEEAARLREQARARERAAQQAAERARAARDAERARGQIRIQQQLDAELRAGLERQRLFRERHQRDLDAQRALAQQLRTRSQLGLRTGPIWRDARTGLWLRPGQTPAQERLARLGPQVSAIDRVAAGAQRVAPLYDAVLKSLTAIFAGWGAGVAGATEGAFKTGAALDVGTMVRDMIRARSQQQIMDSPDATRSDNPLHVVDRLQVTVRGTVAKTAMDRVVSAIASDFANRLAEAEASLPAGLPNREKRVGQLAHQMVQRADLPQRCKQFGIPADRVLIEPMTGATGRGGGQTFYDIGIESPKRWSMIELKASGYEVPRTEWQLQTHLIGVGEGTATYGKAGDYYRVLAKERTILKWTSESLARQALRPRGVVPRGRVR